MSEDPTRAFLESLPEIKPGELFWFSCHPAVPCFNACCSDLTMPLMPYDVLRLHTGLDMGSEQFIEEFTIPGCYQDTGFPLLHLRMEPGPGRPCPFLTEQGCGVYQHRSAACRTYPLGRAVDTESAASAARYFLVREDHCKGFAEKASWTIDAWLADQGLEQYNRMHDSYTRLIGRYKNLAGSGVALSEKHATLALLCLYQQDRFLEFIRSMELFSRVRFTCLPDGLSPQDYKALIEKDAATRLCFAFDWMELVLLGSSPALEPAI